jgi:H+/Cl- antiporter ClcA
MRKEQTRTKTGNKLRALRRWMLIALIGVTVGLVGVLVSYLSRYLSSWRNGTFLHLFALEHEKKLKEGTALGVLLGISCSYVLLASWMVAYVEPAGAGSGIPEVKCLLNGIELPRMMALRTLIVKVLGMTLSTTSGLAVGREGPMVHAGAMVAANVARGFTLCGCARFDEFGSDVEVRGAVSCGTASGLAAAFNAPVGGLLLVIEEGISFWSAQLTWRVVFTAMLAAYIVAVLQSTVHISGTPTVGPFGNLNNPGLFSFGTFDNSNNSYRIYDLPRTFCVRGLGRMMLPAPRRTPKTVSLSLFPPSLLRAVFLAVGAAGGLFGIVFNALASSVATWRATYVGGPRPCCCCARPREPVWYLRPFCWVGWCPATTEEELVEARASDSATPLLATSDAADDGALGNTTTPNTTFTIDGDDAVTATSSVSSSTSLSASIVASRRNLCAGARTGDAAIPFKKLADAVIVTAIVVLIEYWLTIEAGECLRIPRGTPKTPPQYLGGLQQFNCRPDHYNDLATFFFNTPDEVIHLLFHYQDGPIMESWKLVLCFLVYSAIMLLGYGVAVPAGLLVPPLVAGAAVGRAIGQGFHFRGWPLAAYGTYSLIGAAAVLGGGTFVSSWWWVFCSILFPLSLLFPCTSPQDASVGCAAQ